MYQLYLSPAEIIQWYTEVVLVLNQHPFMGHLVTHLFKVERIKDNVVTLPTVTRKPPEFGRDLPECRELLLICRLILILCFSCCHGGMWWCSWLRRKQEGHRFESQWCWNFSLTILAELWLWVQLAV